MTVGSTVESAAGAFVLGRAGWLNVNNTMQVSPQTVFAGVQRTWVGTGPEFEDGNLAAFKQMAGTILRGESLRNGTGVADTDRLLRAAGIEVPTTPHLGMVVHLSDERLVSNIRGVTLELGYEDSPVYARSAPYSDRFRWAVNTAPSGSVSGRPVAGLVVVDGAEPLERTPVEDEARLLREFKHMTALAGFQAKRANSWCTVLENVLGMLGLGIEDSWEFATDLDSLRRNQFVLIQGADSACVAQWTGSALEHVYGPRTDLSITDATCRLIPGHNGTLSRPLVSETLLALAPAGTIIAYYDGHARYTKTETGTWEQGGHEHQQAAFIGGSYYLVRS